MLDSTNIFKLHLMGRFKLISPTGQIVEIPSKKSKALIAILATSPDGERTRTWLQSHLWSRGSSQASLRKELSKIRAVFDIYKTNVFIESTPKDIVRINRQLFNIDLQPTSDNESFLEGLSLPTEALFENWIAHKRTILNTPKENTTGDNTGYKLSATQTIITKKSSRILPKKLCIALNPIVRKDFQNNKYISHFDSDDFLSRIGRLLLSSGLVEIIDRRNDIRNDYFNLKYKPAPCDLEIQIMFFDQNFETKIAVTAWETNKNTILISRRLELAHLTEGSQLKRSMYLKTLVSEISDELFIKVNKSAQASREHQHLIQLVNGSIEHMFDLTHQGLVTAQENLDHALEFIDESPVYAWRAFLTTLSIDSHSTVDHKVIQDEAIYYAERAIEADKYNPLTLSLLTHVNAFTLQDLNRAKELMNQANRIGSDHVMYYDAESLLHLYLGQLSKARKTAIKAAEIGQMLPFRYLFMTTLCMLDGLEGNYLSAVEAGEKALSLQPKNAERPYPPTIRYLSQSYSKLGQQEKSLQLIEILKTADANLKIGSQKDENKVSPSEVVRQFLEIGSKHMQ